MIQDQTLTFSILNKTRDAIFQFVTPKSSSCFDEAHLVRNSIIPAQLLKDYHDVQHRLDPIFDNGQLYFYKQARDELFPKAKRGSLNHANRAGDKVEEIFGQTKILQNLRKDFTFADVCAAPGSWSLFVLQKFTQSRGVGMSMPVEGTPLEKTWYPDLYRSERFKITFGEDKTGNVYSSKNMVQFNEDCKAHFKNPDEQNVDLFMCDGGFEIQKDPQGKHCEHLQEIITSRLLTSEFLFAMKYISPNGSFVCKMYDSITEFSVQLLFLMYSQCSELIVIKPEHSRVINAEKYLVFTGFVKNQNIVEKLEQLYQSWENNCVYDKIIEECDDLANFRKWINQLNERLIKRTIGALDMVIKRVSDMAYNEMHFSEQRRLQNAYGGYKSSEQYDMQFCRNQNRPKNSSYRENFPENRPYRQSEYQEYGRYQNRK